MEEEPKIEDVLKNIYDLYGNPDCSKKEGASKYLAKLQDSVSEILILVMKNRFSNFLQFHQFFSFS